MYTWHLLACALCVYWHVHLAFIDIFTLRFVPHLLTCTLGILFQGDNAAKDGAMGFATPVKDAKMEGGSRIIVIAPESEQGMISWRLYK